MITIGALALCVIAYMIIGMLWYSPLLFGNIWAKLTGRGSENMQMEDMTRIYLLSSISSLVMAFVLNYVMTEVEVQNISQALLVGFMLWLGFAFTSTTVNNLFQGRPRRLIFIDSGYFLASSLAMSAILFFMMYP
ncbi:hypothetical protein BH09PAT2_BH09PAT2_09950 [soil metagenome]